ncbi:ion transporter [Persicirhabdus sediminis]|uniref:Ion transporter n=2 Tax=Persicirhabdus sediminis TaxID=454144 RepID=A0A8J7SP05_9BACT|nr:ion transporter [Persicirhabdus sediminis]
MWLIGFSVLTVMLESIPSINAKYSTLIHGLEWFFTIAFTLEYALRIWLVRRPSRYIFSFYGVVDLLSCLPTYLALLDPTHSSFAVIRVLRLLRMFRVMKMVHHIRGANTLMRGLRSAAPKITVFFTSVLLLSIVAGTIIYFIESGVEDTKFTSIPISVYYAIVSITTVGYGDITAVTALGKIFTTLLILTGYAIIAVPTGIVTSEMINAHKQDETTDACPSCGVHGHLIDAKFCRRCGEKLD